MSNEESQSQTNQSHDNNEEEFSSSPEEFRELTVDDRIFEEDFVDTATSDVASPSQENPPFLMRRSSRTERPTQNVTDQPRSVRFDPEAFLPEVEPGSITETDKQIGIWGVRKSGKTTYLAMLAQTIGKSRRFLSLSPLIKIRGADKRSIDFVIEHASRLLSNGLFPKPTDVGEEHIEIYNFDLFQIPYWKHLAEMYLNKNVMHEKLELKLLDASGEWFEYERFEELERQYNAAATRIRNYLASCDGIIVLVDPSDMLPTQDDDSSTPSRAPGVVDLLKLLLELPLKPGTSYVSPALAICITKVDEPGRWENRTNPSALAKAAMPTTVRSSVEQLCSPNNYAYFGISAIGIVKDGPGRYAPNRKVNPDPDTSKDSPYVLRDLSPEPFGLLEPLKWLLKKV